MNSDATSLQKSEKLLESLIGPISDLFLPSANEVCEGYVFTCVCLSTGGCRGPGGLPRGVSRPRGCVQAQAWGVSRPRPSGVCIPACTDANTPPPPADGYCCGRYASYWNALLLLPEFTTR